MNTSGSSDAIASLLQEGVDTRTFPGAAAAVGVADSIRLRAAVGSFTFELVLAVGSPFAGGNDDASISTSFVEALARMS